MPNAASSSDVPKGVATFFRDGTHRRQIWSRGMVPQEILGVQNTSRRIQCRGLPKKPPPRNRWAPSRAEPCSRTGVGAGALAPPWSNPPFCSSGRCFRRRRRFPSGSTTGTWIGSPTALLEALHARRPRRSRRSRPGLLDQAGLAVVPPMSKQKMSWIRNMRP